MVLTPKYTFVYCLDQYWSGFKSFSPPPWWRHGMARMAIRDSGQRQKHGASLLGEITEWFLQFSGDHHLTTPATSMPSCGPPLLQTSAAVAATAATAAAVVVVTAISAIVPAAVVAADQLGCVRLPRPVRVHRLPRKLGLCAAAPIVRVECVRGVG